MKCFQTVHAWMQTDMLSHLIARLVAEDRNYVVMNRRLAVAIWECTVCTRLTRHAIIAWRALVDMCTMDATYELARTRLRLWTLMYATTSFWE